MKKSFLILLSLTLVLTACGGAAEEEVVEEPAVVEEVETLDKPATTAAPVLDKIIFGFVPSAEQTDLQDNIQPLMTVLSEGLGIEVEGFVTSDYSGLLVAMGSGQVEIFDAYYDKYKKRLKWLKQTQGTTRPNLWNAAPPKRKKRKKPSAQPPEAPKG